MISYHLKLIVFVVALITIKAPCYADALNSFCEGPSSLLNLTNRPTNADSPCSTPLKHLVVQSGYQYVDLYSGSQQNAPNSVLRLGIMPKTEVVLSLPNYIYQSTMSISGLSSTTLGTKYQFVYNQKWLLTGEILVTPSSGSSAFGNASTNAALVGIFEYIFNEQFTLTIQLSGSTQTASWLGGGNRYESINPDLVLAYAFNDSFDIYGEIYGQSKTSLNQGSGFNADFGMLYLIKPTLAIDLEAGQRVNGNLGSFNHYFGTGITLLLG